MKRTESESIAIMRLQGGLPSFNIKEIEVDQTNEIPIVSYSPQNKKSKGDVCGVLKFEMIGNDKIGIRYIYPSFENIITREDLTYEIDCSDLDIKHIKLKVVVDDFKDQIDSWYNGICQLNVFEKNVITTRLQFQERVFEKILDEGNDINSDSFSSNYIETRDKMIFDLENYFTLEAYGFSKGKIQRIFNPQTEQTRTEIKKIVSNFFTTMKDRLKEKYDH